MKIRFAVSAALIATGLLLGAFPSNALGSATVTLRLSNEHYSVITKQCAVSVAEGADGAAVLEAARVSGCISGYELGSFPGFGRYVLGIDGRRQADVHYWAMRENCRYTDYGIDDFYANHGDELSFSYETWATFAVPVVRSPLNPLGCL